jgi:hypothetical protein
MSEELGNVVQSKENKTSACGADLVAPLRPLQFFLCEGGNDVYTESTATQFHVCLRSDVETMHLACLCFQTARVSFLSPRRQQNAYPLLNGASIYTRSYT